MCLTSRSKSRCRRSSCTLLRCTRCCRRRRSYLKRFPVEALKVDRSFIDGLGREPEDSAICTAVISLAHALGLRAVAEGVETPEQLAELRTLGCEMAQGYLFGKPAEVYGERPDERGWSKLAHR